MQVHIPAAFASTSGASNSLVPQAVIDAVDRNFEQDVLDIREILRQPSVSATGEGMVEAAAGLLDYFKQLGFAAQLIGGEFGGYPAIYAEIPGVSPETLLIYGHYDVQPPDPLEEWEYPPFSATLVGDRIYARGSVDDKGNFLCALKAVEAYLKAEVPLPLNIKFLLDSLVKYKDEDLSLQPGLAEKWEVSSDGLVYTFHLRKDVKFHDGSPMKADDVIASWTRGLLKETAASVTYVLDPIKGAKDVMQGKTNIVEGLKKIDDNTLQVTLEKPNAAFLTSLGHPNAGVYKVVAAQKGGKDFGTPGSKPEWVIGTGPFKFVEWKADQQITLAKNTDYWGDKAHVDKVTYRIFKDEGTAVNEFRAGNLEYVDLLPPGQRQSLLKEFPNQIIRTTALATYFLGYNMEKEPYKSNLKLRQALSYAVDRQAIIDTVYEGVSTPAKGPLPMGMPGFDKDVKAPAYDKEKAKQLLSEAGFPDGKGLQTLEIKYNFSQLNQKIMEAVQGMFKEIGVNSKLINQEWGAHIKSLQTGDSQIFRLAWSADYPDPDNFLYALYHSSQKGDNNDSFYGNPVVDRLLSEGRMETDPAKRMKIYQEAERTIIQDAPAIWLFNVQYLHLYAKNVHNLYPNALEQKHMARVWLS